MRKFLIGIFGLLSLASCAKPEPPKQTGPREIPNISGPPPGVRPKPKIARTPPLPEVKPVPVKLEELVAAYRKDAAKARAKYDGQTLEFEGVVESVQLAKEAADPSRLVLAGPPRAACEMISGQEAGLHALRPRLSRVRVWARLARPGPEPSFSMCVLMAMSKRDEEVPGREQTAERLQESLRRHAKGARVTARDDELDILLPEARGADIEAYLVGLAEELGYKLRLSGFRLVHVSNGKRTETADLSDVPTGPAAAAPAAAAGPPR